MAVLVQRLMVEPFHEKAELVVDTALEILGMMLAELVVIGAVVKILSDGSLGVHLSLAIHGPIPLSASNMMYLSLPLKSISRLAWWSVRLGVTLRRQESWDCSERRAHLKFGRCTHSILGES